ncbi:OLC1v1003157C1 [Oldenlandia corymbosa var. corymbosa]|uniref:HVA22-like protein n=1 Tax=Oldenlandia corymbosa var. corymbosa TaxID=529605 RepID=A0AAV1DA70_OLDCO|nr:OLC1v1003157C1 [Oldenlandia corymbosa var. corymbosa]
MAMLGSNIPSEVGLKLLLCPLGSNVVIRTACCTVGIGLPVYSTFKAIQSREQNEQQKWLIYWAAYGSFSIVEAVTDKFLYWFPFYYHMKFAFLVWLQFPSADGSRQLYVRYLRPFLRKHQARFDQLVGVLQTETAKFANAYKAELQLAKALLSKIFISARDIVHPGQRINGAIEGPTAEEESSESDDEED